MFFLILFVIILCRYHIFFFFKTKTAYDVRISDWSSDVCSSDLTVSPSTTVVSAIDGNRTSVQADGNSSSNSMTFAFSANDTGGDEGKGVGINHFECKDRKRVV